MNISFIYTNFEYKELTGQQGIVAKLIAFMTKKGASVTIISNSFKKKSQANIKQNIKLINGSASIKTIVLNYFKLYTYIKKLKSKIVVINGAKLAISLIPLMILSKKKPILLLSETTEKFNKLYILLLKFSLNKVNYIFVTAEYLKTQLISLGIQKNNIAVLRLGLNDSFLTKKEKVQAKYDVVYFGDSSLNRGLDLVYKTAKHLKKLKFLVLIRFEEKSCEKIMSELRQMKNVTVFKYPYKKDLQYYLRRAKIIFLPFKFMMVRPPISLIESMAIGKCVITSDLAANSEIIKNDVNGYMVNLMKVDESIDLINYLIQNDKKRNRIAAAARKKVIKLYSKNQYTKFYKIIESYL